MEPPPPAIPVTRADIKAVANADPALTDPAVAKRRGEVFAGIPPQPPEPKSPALKEGEPMMTPAQRRKELYSLAEEMELLYARTVSN